MHSGEVHEEEQNCLLINWLIEAKVRPYRLDYQRIKIILVYVLKNLSVVEIMTVNILMER